MTLSTSSVLSGSRFITDTAIRHRQANLDTESGGETVPPETVYCVCLRVLMCSPFLSVCVCWCITSSCLFACVYVLPLSVCLRVFVCYLCLSVCVRFCATHSSLFAFVRVLSLPVCLRMFVCLPFLSVCVCSCQCYLCLSVCVC